MDKRIRYIHKEHFLPKQKGMNGSQFMPFIYTNINYILQSRGREKMTTPKLRFSAITLKYLSQHITYKLALSLTRQLKLTLLFLCLSPQQIVNTSTKTRPFVTQKNFVHLLLCLHYYPVLTTNSCSYVTMSFYYSVYKQLVYSSTFSPSYL